MKSMTKTYSYEIDKIFGYEKLQVRHIYDTNTYTSYTQHKIICRNK
jgi:hypothetical protein